MDPLGNEEGKTKRKKAKKESSSTTKSIEHTEGTQISQDDLEELRSVYQKCKSVMKKLDSKYGHLLNSPNCESKKRTNKLSDSEDSDLNRCECNLNKKIIFDDNGQVIITKTDSENHICVKKLRKTQDREPLNNVQVEYDLVDNTLPDDIQSLTNILHDQDIEITLRNKVIQKIKSIEKEYTDELKFNKHLLIEKLKLDPDEILGFKGTNLKTLPGYK